MLRDVATVALVLLTNCHVAHAQQRSEPTALDAGRAIAVGADLSPSAACFRCHGMDGGGDAAAVFPRLDGQSDSYLYESLKDYASGARENAVMSPIARELSDQQMYDVSAYYTAQSANVAAPTIAFPDTELLQRGAAIAAVGHAARGVQGCNNCHGPAGRGLGGAYPYLGGQFASYLEAQLKAWKSGARRSSSLTEAAMEHIARQLSDDDIRAVAIYFASIQPERKRAALPAQSAAPAPAHPADRPGR